MNKEKRPLVRAEALEGMTQEERRDALLHDMRLYFRALYHEAAHAVLGFYAGLQVESVAVRFTEEGGRALLDGECLMGGPFYPWDALKVAGANLGGMYAEWRCQHDREDMEPPTYAEFLKTTPRTDGFSREDKWGGFSREDKWGAMKALHFALQYYRDSRHPMEELQTMEGCYDAAVKEMLSDLEDHWPEIGAVANAIMEAVDYGEPLSGEEVEKIIESVEAEEVA